MSLLKPRRCGVLSVPEHLEKLEGDLKRVSSKMSGTKGEPENASISKPNLVDTKTASVSKDRMLCLERPEMVP